MNRPALFAAIAMTGAAWAVPMQPPPQDGGAAPRVTAERGIAGAIEFRAAGPRLRASANQSVTSPIVVRIAEATAEADGKTTHYRVEFIGAYAGDFDLRASLEREDGSAIDLSPMTVRILSQLAPDHGTDLFSSSETPLLHASWYRAGMIILATAWVAVPVAYFVVRAIRRRPAPVEAPAPPAPTFADQLRPLVQAAIAGSMSVAERGRLELLLYLYWRGRLGLEGRQADVIPHLRHHREAGTLLRAVERWLHGRRDGSAVPDAEVAAMLEPYRGSPAISGAGGGASPAGTTVSGGVEGIAVGGAA